MSWMTEKLDELFLHKAKSKMNWHNVTTDQSAINAECCVSHTLPELHIFLYHVFIVIVLYVLITMLNERLIL